MKDRSNWLLMIGYWLLMILEIANSQSSITNPPLLAFIQPFGYLFPPFEPPWRGYFQWITRFAKNAMTFRPAS